MSNVTLLVESVRAAHTYNLLLSQSYAHPTSTLSQSSYSFVDPVFLEAVCMRQKLAKSF